MDYKKAWNMLRDEVRNLGEQGVQSVHPALLLRTMDFVEQVVTYQEQLQNQIFKKGGDL